MSPVSRPASICMMVMPVSRVAGLDRALDRRRAAPARQQRGMDVQAAQARQLEHPLRQDQAVGRDDHHVGPRRLQRASRAARASSAYLPSSRRLRGWATAMPCCERELLDRRGLQLHAAAGRAVGLRQHQRRPRSRRRDAARQRDGRELGRAGEGDAQRLAAAAAASGAPRSSRAFFSILVLMRSRLSGLRYSTNTLPSRWSISCCTQTASSPSASNS